MWRPTTTSTPLLGTVRPGGDIGLNQHAHRLLPGGNALVGMTFAAGTFIKFLLQHLIDFVVFVSRATMIALRPTSRWRGSFGREFIFVLIVLANWTSLHVSLRTRGGRARRFSRILALATTATAATATAATVFTLFGFAFRGATR